MSGEPAATPAEMPAATPVEMPVAKQSATPAVAPAELRAEIDQLVAGKTMPSMFLETVKSNGDAIAFRWKAGGEWHTRTWNEHSELVARAAAGLRSLGVNRGDRVLLMVRNRPEFHAIDTAALFLGATPVSAYNSSSADQCKYVAEHCEARVVIVDTAAFIERWLKVRTEVSSIEHLVGLDSEGDADLTAGSVFTTSDPLDLVALAADVKPDDLITIIYTSGTTGPSKGVMLSHYNIVWSCESVQRALPTDPQGFRSVSYLPMAHIAERMMSHYLGIAHALQVTTCPDPSLLLGYLGESKPEILFGVPRVWEKAVSGVNAFLAADPDKKQKFDDGVAVGKELATKRAFGTMSDDDIATWEFLDAIAFSQVRQLIGLDDLKIAVSSAAPIPPSVIDWLRGIGLPVSEMFGMSECCGPMTFEGTRVKVGSVGRAFPGVELKLLSDGELCCRGGNVFVGYLGDPVTTAETVDAEGWLHTGDIATMDDEGYVRIVDRKKELLITAGGKNVSPANLENALKSFPLIGQACAVGEGQAYIGALIILDPDITPGWAAQNGAAGTTLAELAGDPVVKDEIERNVREANAQFNQAERIKRWTILPDDWEPDTDLLTPTMKLKRRGVHARYSAEIDALFA